MTDVVVSMACRASDTVFRIASANDIAPLSPEKIVSAVVLHKLLQSISDVKVTGCHFSLLLRKTRYDCVHIMSQHNVTFTSETHYTSC